MGYEFDDNGKYVGWSDLFNYSTIETLKASEHLPIPDGVIYEKKDEGFDISEDIAKIAAQTEDDARIREYADLLIKLQDVGKTTIKGKRYTYLTWNENIPEEVAQKVLADLNKHSQTFLSPQKVEKCLKNSVSSSITNIIQNLRNMDQAYSPIEMGTVRRASEGSPKGSKSDRMTLMNPLTKFVMQEQNMVGKGVIGITAVGEKVFFNTSYYWNEGIRSGDETWIRNLQFSRTFSRIQGRADGIGSLTPVTKTTLANVNFEGFEEFRLKFIETAEIDRALREKYFITDLDIAEKNTKWQMYHNELLAYARSHQDSDIYADDLISQLLSAATDNAKELILAKINAGTNLARCYLHLIMMGFNMSDIVKFMTCPAVSLINDLSTSNMFDEYMFKVKITDAINILRGNIPLHKFFYGRVLIDGENRSLQDLAFIKVKTALLTRLQNLGFTMDKKVKGQTILVPKIYKNLKSIILDYWVCRLNGSIEEPLMSFVSGASLNTRINNNLTALSDYIDNVVGKVLNSEANLQDFMLDVEEFAKVYELASETSTLGSVFLGLNQGIPTSKEDLLNKIFKITSAMGERESVYGIKADIDLTKEDAIKVIGKLLEANPLLTYDTVLRTLEKAQQAGLINNFDFMKWLNNENGYRKLVSDYYNIIKGTWNIFDIVDRLPHFDAIFKAFQAILVTDKALIRKSYMLDKMCQDIFEDSNYIDSLTIEGLLDYTDDLLILRWLNKNQFKFPVFEGDTLFKFNWKAYKSTGTSLLSIVDEASRGSFKQLFEERLIPHLLEGYYYDIDEDGNSVRVDIMKNNQFLKNLVFDVNNDGQPYLKLDLDMQNTSATSNNESRYLECLSDFIKLKNYKLNGMALTDWIMIYNLLVNKNKFGSDRLTTLFGQFIGMIKEPSVIKSILTSTGELDYAQGPAMESMEDLIELGYNKYDALYKIAPIISKNLEVNSQAAMVKEYKDGRIIVKRRKFNTYGEAEEIIPDSTDLIQDERESQIDLLQRLKNYNKYSVIKTPFANKAASAMTNLSSSDVLLVLSALLNYIKQGIIEIYTENC